MNQYTKWKLRRKAAKVLKAKRAVHLREITPDEHMGLILMEFKGTADSCDATKRALRVHIHAEKV